MISNDWLQRWLLRVWWPLFPCFTALTLRLTLERACADPYDLLPALTAQPELAWALGSLYLVAHLWLLVAYWLVVVRTQLLAPPWSAIREVWLTDMPKLLSMAGLLIIEYSPMPLWRLIGTSLRCSR